MGNQVFSAMLRRGFGAAVVLAILVFSGTGSHGAGAAKSPESKDAAGGFKVANFAPAGKTAVGNPITVTFTQDVVSSKKLQTTRTAEALISFSPSIDGAYSWESPRILKFTPIPRLRNCTQYVARISPLIRDTKGRKLEGTAEFKFNTPALDLKQAEQADFSGDRSVTIQLVFSDEIVPSDLARYLTVWDGDTKVNWRVESDVKNARPRIKTDPVRGTGLKVRVEKGLPGVSGPLGLDRQEERTVKLNFGLLPEKLSARWAGEKLSLVVSMSGEVKTENLRSLLTIEPPVAFEVGTYNKQLNLTGDFKPETRYTVRLAKGIVGTNGETMKSGTELSVWAPPMKPFLQMKDAGGHLSKNGTMKLRVRSAGIKALSFRAIRLFDNNLIYFINRDGGSYNVQRLGTEVVERDIPVAEGPGAVTTLIDLREILGASANGVYSFSVNPADSEESADEGETIYLGDDLPGINDSAVVSISNLGIVSKQSGPELAVWVAALDTAKPLAGIKVRAYSAKNQMVKEGETGPDGMVVLSGYPETPDFKPTVVVATAPDDMSYLNLQDTMNREEDAGGDEGRPFLSKGYEAFVSTERGAYRPGETVHVFGYVRGTGWQTPKPFPMEVQLERPDDRRLEPRTITPTETGAFSIDLNISPTQPTGLYQVHLQLPGTAQRREKQAAGKNRGYYDDEEGGDGSAADRAREEIGLAEFFVEDFLPNRLKTEATAPEGRAAKDHPLEVSVKAAEMFGAPAAGRTVSAVATFRPEPFAPERFKGYTFGNSDIKFAKSEKELGETTTEDDGSATVTLEMPETTAPAALKVEIQVTVKDVGGRGVTSRLERIVDPWPFYIGGKVLGNTYPQAGKDAEIEVVGVKPDASLIGDETLSATISRVYYNSVLKKEYDGSFHYVTNRELSSVKQQSVSLVAGTGKLGWTPASTGQYLLQVADGNGNVRLVMPIYVSAGQWDAQPWALDKPETAELILDKSEYRPGDTAKILVKSPFPGTLLLTFEQDRVVSRTIVEMTQNTQEISVPIGDDFLPNVYAAATVLRAVKPAGKWLPHRAFGSIDIPVSGEPRRIAVEVTAPAEIRPKSDFNVSLALKDPKTSAPAPGEVTVWAVDEGVLTLTGFETPDPIDFFYLPRKLMVATADFFSSLMPDIIDPAQAKSATGGGDEADRAKRLSPVATERVKPVSLWLGTLKTDSEGKASATFKVPQFMGRLRVMAVGAKDSRFGNADATVFVRSPIMVKENLPRFLAPGDRAKVPFVVYNNTDQAGEATLELESSGTVRIMSAKSQKVQVPARGMATQYVDVQADDKAGVAHISFSGKLGGEIFSDSVNLPVRPAAPYTRNTIIQSAAGGTQKSIPVAETEFLEGTSSGSLTVSGLPTVNLAGGLNYLLHYPYGCVEQTVSSAFPLLYLADLAQQLEPGRFNPDAIKAYAQAGADRIFSMQTASGGLSMWPGSREPWPWGSVYAGHFLVAARKAGYQTGDAEMAALLGYLADRLKMDIATKDSDLLTEKSYICYVLTSAGKPPRSAMENLYEKRATLTPTARALLAGAYMASGSQSEAQTLLQLAIQDKDSTSSSVRETGGILSSPTRETAILLATYLDVAPGDAVIPSLVKRLEASRKAEHWGTTQENAFALWALGKYAQKVQQSALPFEGTVQFDNQPSQAFSAAKPLTTSVPSGAKTAKVDVTGPGNAFIYAALEGVPKKPDASAAAHGLTVKREFTDRDGNPLNPAELPQGKFIVVEITLNYDRIMSNVVVEDLLPAGLEIENANLATSERTEDSEADSRSGRTEARDDRMLAFLDLPATKADDNSETAQDKRAKQSKNPGYQHIFRYGVRAITEGTFVLPAAQASSMYDPDVYGRSTSGSVTVLKKSR
ncbi:MAG: hypothetical protein K1X53_02685 [Candidatus Sumerlaeaceae bacterium]|nr:hypothetical protein [Candidatus Sumerlaeaceae bacterium]